VTEQAPRSTLVFRAPEAARAQRRDSCVALGVFDGVHRGHQAVLRMASARARERGWRSMALTFDPHPAQVLGRVPEPFLLSSLDVRLARIAACGIDAVLVLSFDDHMRTTPPDVFVREILVESAGARTIVCGPDFRFGHRREGDVARLRALGAELGFEVGVCPPVIDGGAPVSSTRIRAAVREGRHDEARRLLDGP
jgi:riboflavin kinase/FMN adenylyltransferase